MFRIAIALVAGVFATACTSPDGPFTARGRPSKPLYEARRHCKVEASDVDDAGAAVTNWRTYEACMADLGWVKQSNAGAGAGPGPTGGGGGPAY
jgi:hypothetical protein